MYHKSVSLPVFLKIGCNRLSGGGGGGGPNLRGRFLSLDQIMWAPAAKALAGTRL